MRVLFASWAGGGHFAPLVPVGWALRAAGHEVLVACHPSETGPILRAGLPALPVGPDLDMFALLRADRRRGGRGEPTAGTGHPPDYRSMLETGETVAELLVDDLVAYCRTWRPDLVVYEPASLIGPLVAGILGVPAVRVLWAFDFTAPVNGYPERYVSPLTERLGLDGISTTGALTLDPCPPRLRVTDNLPRQPIRYVPYNGPTRMPDWLREKPAKPRICVTWGTSLHALGPQRMVHVPRVVHALGRLDAEIVVAVLDSHRPLFGEPPPNVRAIGPVALSLLLPTCDAIVHQGGGGTSMTAVVNGVAQVVVPTIADQIFNAESVHASGAGLLVPGGEDVTEEDVVTSTVEVLRDPRFREVARELRAEILAMPTPADVRPVLEALATGVRA